MQLIRTKHVWPRVCKNHQRFVVTMCTRNNLREIKFVVTVGTSVDDEAHKVELIYSLGDGVSYSCCCCCCCCCDVVILIMIIIIIIIIVVIIIIIIITLGCMRVIQIKLQLFQPVN